MSENVLFDRRDFLKLVGIGVAGAATGCAKPPADKLIPYLVGPADILPGVPYWFASTCRECPAGCGVLVKQREGRAIKIEGNPDHPVNRGGLCARGQAGLQGLYDPDRLRTPMVKQNGRWKPTTWEEGLKLAAEKLGEAVRAKRGVAIVTDNATGSFERLAREWAAAAGGVHVVYEAFAHESLREANRRTFGVASVPHYDFASARMVISFGADFLESWVLPTGHARGFAAMRSARNPAHFVAVEPRLSLTGANADEWIAIRPGGEMALALGLAHVILTEGLGPPVAERGALLEAVSAFTPEAVEQQTEVPAERIKHLARHFAQATPSLALAGGIANQSEQSVALIASVNLLNYVAGNLGRTLRFDRTLNFEAVSAFSEVQRLTSAMGEGRIDVLVVHNANPAYSTPGWAGFGIAMDRVVFKISLTPWMDETAERCDLILPAPHALESVGDAEPARGVWSVMQPTMQRLPMFDTRPAGDTLIALAKEVGLPVSWPGTWHDYVRAQWKPLHQRFGGENDFDGFWNDALRRGGVWEDPAAVPARWTGTPAFASPQLKGPGEFALVIYASSSLFDGRGANKAWLQELPDPTSKAVWGSWVEIHPETAAKLGVRRGDPVKIESEAGSVELPAYLYSGIRKDTVAVPLGQGHTAYGRYAKGRGVNALALLPPAQDGASGAVAYLSANVKLSRGTQTMDLVTTQSYMDQNQRAVAQVIPLSELLGVAPKREAEPPHGGEEVSHSGPGVPEHAPGLAEHIPSPAQKRPGAHTEPYQHPEGYKTPAHAMTAYKGHEAGRGPRAIPITEGDYKKGEHRWAMAIDLNACTGCSACVVACYAENNIPTVGPEMIKRGREMAWIRIERFEDKIEPNGRTDVRNLPMMCQHCGDAPCEIVCPIYATYHNPEGLNVQVYNRCVGTRYCSNNCPYKVRSFNWFDYTAPEKATFAYPEPLNWQLNPDVTVRSKGVMEKCTMCVQRILEGKGNARDGGRALRDGEIVTACAQTCPTQAIVFGDLMDPESQVHKLSFGARPYWVLEELNTKPGVTYLKKVQWESV